MLNKNVKSQLCTADLNKILRVDGIGMVQNISNVKYCPDATTDLISICKLGEIDYRVSVDDEEGPVVSVLQLKYGLNWITEKRFLYLAHVY